MSEILCRIDPEELASKFRMYSGLEDFCDYITAHAVPEPPVLFGGVEEVADWLRDKSNIYTSWETRAKALLDRFGIPWDKAPEWAIGGWFVFTEKDQCTRGAFDDNLRFAGKAKPGPWVDRPALSLEVRREKARKLLETADDELLKRLGV